MSASTSASTPRSGARSRQVRTVASATTLALVLGALVVLAFRYDGKPFTEVELNDGGVWVTNDEMGLAARLNPQIKELDLGVDAGTKDFDIFQRAAELYVDDASSDRAVKPVDIARASVIDPTSLPTGAVVAHGGDTFAVVDPVTGKGWVRSAADMAEFSAKTSPDVDDALTAAVGTNGRGWILHRDGTATSFEPSEGGAVAGETVRLGDDLGTDASMVQMTVIGDVPVVYSAVSLELSRPDTEPVVLETADPSKVALQTASPGAESFYVATEEGLLVLPIGGSEPTRVSRGEVRGRPAAPVVLSSTGCVYAAWADPTSPNNYLRDCPDDADDDEQAIPGMQPGAVLRFRVNRDVVVLNDVLTGDAWLVQDPGKAKIDNWPAVDPNNQNKSKVKETSEEVPEQENRPPEPEDDDLGARPGRSTVLPVVALNDHDPDGDIISISKTVHESGPELEVKIVGGGTQLQVAVPADAEGESVFRYYVTDGRVNGEVYARVRLDIRTDAENAPPKKMDDREPKLRVASGATSSYYLLADFYDLDGDDLTLTDADARGGEVEFRPDGTITFADTGAGGEVSEIEFTIEDGRSDPFVGKLDVEILGDKAPPELVPDLTSGVADRRVVVQPLTNDRNPEGTDLTLKSVRVMGDDAGTEISKDLESGTFTFYSSKAKSYYLEYTAYNSSATGTSFIRLDIESPPKDNRPPVAVRDKAVITPGGTAQVDLLLNDLDPDGDVLVVKRIGRPSIAGVKVSVVDKRLAVVSSATDIVGEQATVEYVVSDGRSEAVGSLVVAQRRSSQANRHPVANKDQTTVRAGSVTSIPVLANDSDPDGAKPRLFQDDLDNPEDLDVWVAGDALRLRAPEEPGTYSVVYGVRDTDGLKATAEVGIYVVADSAKNNNPPVPQPIVDRVIAGRPKVISVDLVDADPDGDAVSFRNILTAPSFGRVLDTGVDWIRYEAFEGKTGTDFFQILVEDKYGATGVAEVRVGVVAEEPENQPPVALDDNVLVQPNRTIAYNVLTNDVDPDDDPLRVDQAYSMSPVEHDGSLIELEVGDAPEHGTRPTNIGYEIRDEAGAVDNAVLRVTASRDAPFYAPIANDDVAELGDIIGREPGQRVVVSVLDNDLDFDGARADLEVTGCDAGSSGECEVRDDGSVSIRLKAQDQVVLYSLDDADDESTGTFGVVHVTGTDNVPPQLTTDEDLVPVKVDAGGEVTFDLTDLVVTRAGRSAQLVADSSPTAVNGTVGPVEDAPTSLRFVPAARHVGPASVTVAVTDGRTAAEDEALTSLLTIPIDVVPVGNVAPTMRGAAVDVAAGGDEVVLDLEGLTRDVNDGDLDAMTWRVAAADDGLTAEVADGSSDLVLSADGGIDDGTTLRVTVVAEDVGGASAEAVVAARVVGSDRPLIRVPPISWAADRDEQVRIDIAEYAVTERPGEPLWVSDPQIEEGGNLAGLDADGSVVTFTPTASGSSTIRVKVTDDPDDPEREVAARINVVVVAVPDAPLRPTLSSVEASSAVLTWREPASNGAAIEDYEVRGSNGWSQTCLLTTCRLNDLTPGESYTFTVRARNSVGWSEESPASEQIVPNRAPDLMTPPTIVEEAPPTGSRMDRQLTLRWTPPTNEGSPITGYEIKEAGSARSWQAGGSATTLVIPGLTNGTPYSFEIRAINEVEPRRQFSAASRPATPFGLPMRSGVAPTLTASEASDYTQQPWVRIEWPKWSESQSNGNQVRSYTVTCDGCNKASYVVDAATSSRTFDAADGIQKGRTVSFTVAATNDAGTGDKSPSVSGRPWTRAGPVRNLTEVGQSPSDRTAMVRWDPPADDGGLSIHHYVIETETGARHTVQAPGGGGTPILFASNDVHSIRVWAVTYNGDRSVEGDTESLGGIRTWGKPGAPDNTTNTSNNHYRVELALRAGAANGQNVEGVEYREPGGSWRSDISSGGQWAADVPRGGEVRTLEVRTVSAASGDRKYSDSVTLTATSRAIILDIEFDPCTFGNDRCGLRISGGGFTRTNHVASISLNGLVPNDQCPPSLDLTVPGAGFSRERVGGLRCLFERPGSASVTVEGVSDSVS